MKFIFKPTTATKDILAMEDSKKNSLLLILVVWIIILSIIWYLIDIPNFFSYLSLWDITPAIAINMVSIFVLWLLMFFFWKNNNWTATLKEVLIITSIAYFSELIVFTVFGLSALIITPLLILVGKVVSFIWFLVVYSKGMASAQNFSEWTVTKNFIFSWIIVIIFFYAINAII